MKTKQKIFNYAIASTLIFGTAAAGYMALNNQNNKPSIVQELKNTQSAQTLFNNKDYVVKEIKSDKNVSAAVVTLPDGKDHLFTWGNNYNGILGYETDELVSNQPREVVLPIDGEIQQIVLGHENDPTTFMSDNKRESMGVIINNSETGLNELWMWGSDSFGKLGLDSQDSTTPHQVLGGPKFNVEKAVLAKDTTAILYEEVNNNGVISNDKNIGLLGNNLYGQLADGGNGDTGDHKDMVSHSELDTNVKINNIWAGPNTFYAEGINNYGSKELYSWGYNGGSDTALGLSGVSMYSSVFKHVGELSSFGKIVDMSSTIDGTVALVENTQTHYNTIYSWGVSYDGSIGFPGTGNEDIIKGPDVVQTTPKIVYSEQIQDKGKDFTSINLIGNKGVALQFFDHADDKNKVLISGSMYGLQSYDGFKVFDLPEEISNEGSQIIFGSGATNIDPYAIDENNNIYHFDETNNQLTPIDSVVNADVGVNVDISAEVKSNGKGEITFSKPNIVNNAFDNKLSEVYVSSEKLGLDHQTLNVDGETVIENNSIDTNQTYDDFVIEAHFANSSYTITDKQLDNKLIPIQAKGSNAGIIAASIIIPFAAILAILLFVFNKKGMITLSTGTGIRTISKKSDKEVTIVLNKKAKYLADKDLVKIYSDGIELKSKISIDENENIIVKITGLTEFTKYNNIKMTYYKTSTGETEEKAIKGSFKTELSE